MMPTKQKTLQITLELTSLCARMHTRVQEMTRGSCVVGWVQLDNQTNDPVAPVVVAPTMVEHPQATLQMSFIRNNIKSHSHLNHFEVNDTLEILRICFLFCFVSWTFCGSFRGDSRGVTVLPLATAGL